MQPERAYPNPPAAKSENLNPSYFRVTRAPRGGEMTFTEIGDYLGVSKVRARQIYLAALSKLRRRLVRNGEKSL